MRMRAGVPQLMMSFTGEGQIKPELLASRDARYGKSTPDLQRERAAALKPPQDTEPGADPWVPFGKVRVSLYCLRLRQHRHMHKAQLAAGGCGIMCLAGSGVEGMCRARAPNHVR